MLKEEDRRVVIVSLTEKGKNVFDIHSVFHKEMIDTILENFHGEDLDVLTRALGKASRFFEKKYESFQQEAFFILCKIIYQNCDL